MEIGVQHQKYVPCPSLSPGTFIKMINNMLILCWINCFWFGPSHYSLYESDKQWQASHSGLKQLWWRDLFVFINSLCPWELGAWPWSSVQTLVPFPVLTLPKQCTLFPVYTVPSVHCSQFTQFTVYTVHSVHSLQCTLCTLHSTLHPTLYSGTKTYYIQAHNERSAPFPALSVTAHSAKNWVSL